MMAAMNAPSSFPYHPKRSPIGHADQSIWLDALKLKSCSTASHRRSRSDTVPNVMAETLWLLTPTAVPRLIPDGINRDEIAALKEKGKERRQLSQHAGGWNDSGPLSTGRIQVSQIGWWSSERAHQTFGVNQSK
jgi:hypothetical protein